jgi:antitoxin component YwqK of YwqJK toxin-antitoxin module
MKRILTIALFVGASTLAFAQYNHVQVGPNGNKIEEGQYNANPGVQPGDSKETIATKMAAVHKTGTWKYWFDNGQIAAEEYYDNNGNPVGIWKNWHNNGQLATEMNQTTGAAVFYHPNGQKAEEGTINANHQRTGAWSGWHENGKLNYTGTYTSTGEKDGTWKFYNLEGVVVTTEVFNNGVKKN